MRKHVPPEGRAYARPGSCALGTVLRALASAKINSNAAHPSIQQSPRGSPLSAIRSQAHPLQLREPHER